MFTLKSRFFKLREPKKFDFVPRHYDPRKEKIKQMMAERQIANEEEALRVERKLQIRETYERNRRYSNQAAQQRARLLRLGVSLAGVLLVTWILIRKFELWEYF